MPSTNNNKRGRESETEEQRLSRNGQFEEPLRNCGLEGNGENVILVPGPAGAGKSYLVDCLVTEAVQRYKEKTGQDGYIVIVAPTGLAALQAGGFSMLCWQP